LYILCFCIVAISVSTDEFDGVGLS
jgi:hypothetical protein